MALVEVREVSKTFGKRKVIDSISFDVDKKSILLIEGPSGSGKSTLLHIIAGIDSPDSGTVLIDGKDIFALTEDKRAKFRLKKIGIIFQNFNLIEDLNVMENIALPLKLAGKRWKDRVEELLKYLNIEHLKYEMPNSLSGGEMQRCAIARALANEPEIIIADEPTSNLDDENTNNISSLFKKINSELGTTMIIATHDPRIINMGTNVLHLHKEAFNEG